MRQEDIKRLSESYATDKTDIDRRFHSALASDVPSAGLFAEEILNDLDTKTFGVRWWAPLLPEHERILISDYFYQCATGIEANLVEAKLHYLEWLETRDKQNERVADMAYITDDGELVSKLPPATKPIDDIPNAMEKLHVCGFFRAIGSAFDCLGGVIVTVLGLPVNLRKADINSAKSALTKLQDDGTQGAKTKIAFRGFMENAINKTGPQDWFDWTTQYRNMFVHRGRRMMMNHLTGRLPVLYDQRGFPIPRMTTTFHLAKHPDKSDVEASILGPTMLNEDASVTLHGVFKSSRELLETLCEELLAIWRARRNDPALIGQPPSQWNTTAKRCKFRGYKPETPPLAMQVFVSNPTFYRRMLASSMDDAHRNLWTGSKWEVE